jgi:hypothetical protein
MNRLCLTTGRDEQGRLIAICSDGSPQLGDTHVTILSLEVVQTVSEAQEWFGRMVVERPWETRQ